MIKVIKSQLFTPDVELTAALFTFLFELEVSRGPDGAFVRLPSENSIFLIERTDVNNMLHIQIPNEEKSSLIYKLQLFNYKNNSDVKLHSDGAFTLYEIVLFSVI